jgi:hypothetical protein
MMIMIECNSASGQKKYTVDQCGWGWVLNYRPKSAVTAVRVGEAIFVTVPMKK